MWKWIIDKFNTPSGARIKREQKLTEERAAEYIQMAREAERDGFFQTALQNVDKAIDCFPEGGYSVYRARLQRNADKKGVDEDLNETAKALSKLSTDEIKSMTEEMKKTAGSQIDQSQIHKMNELQNQSIEELFQNEAVQAMYQMMKVMNAMHISLKELDPKIKSDSNPSEFTEEILILAFMARKGVQDRMVEYNWMGNAPVHIESISDDYIQLNDALYQTVGKLFEIARDLNMTHMVDDIMMNGPGYNQVLKIIPKYILDDI